MIRHEQSLHGKLYSFSQDFRHALDRSLVPVIASELYNVSHEVPLLFEKRDEDWHVQGVLASRGLRRSLIGVRGEWRGHYAPFALRIHPFRRTAGDDGWEVDPEKVVDPPGRGRPFFQADGSPAAEYARVRTMLEEADRGRAMLAGRAGLLERQSLLVPFAVAFAMDDPADDLAALFCVDAVRLAGLAPAMLAGLAGGAPSALDLAFASIYSMRLLKGQFSTEAAADLETRIATLIGQSLADFASGGPPPPSSGGAHAVPLHGFALDPSETIDFARLF